jgi:hypothetical protein
LRSLTTRKSTFLSRPEWISIPWSTRTKNSFHQFLDLAGEAPGLLEEVDNLAAGNTRAECVPSGHYDVALRTLDLINRMKSWEMVKSPRLPQGPPHVFSSSGTSMIPTDKLQPRAHRYPSRNPRATAADFDGLQAARLMLFYWAVRLTLHTSIHNNSYFSASSPGIDPEIENSNAAFISTPTNSLAIEADSLADKITLWADFCCQNAWQSFGPAIGIFSVKVAIDWYQARQRKSLQELHCHTLLAHLTYCDRNGGYQHMSPET